MAEETPTIQEQTVAVAKICARAKIKERQYHLLKNVAQYSAVAVGCCLVATNLYLGSLDRSYLASQPAAVRKYAETSTALRNISLVPREISSARKMKTNYYSPDLKALTSKAVKRLEEISLERITELDNSVTEINCMRDYLLANEPAVKKYVDKGSRVFKERALGGGLAVASIFALGFLGFLFEKKKDFYSRQEAEKEFEFRCLRKHLKQESKPQAIH